MPVHTGKDSKGCFAQWGNQSKYHYPCGDTNAMNKAKQKAHIQGGVIQKVSGKKYEMKNFNVARYVIKKSGKENVKKKTFNNIIALQLVRAAKESKRKPQTGEYNEIKSS